MKVYAYISGMARNTTNSHPAINGCIVILSAEYINNRNAMKTVLSHTWPNGNPAYLYITCRAVRNGGLNWLLVVSRFTVKTELTIDFSLTAYSAITSGPDVKSLGVGGR